MDGGTDTTCLFSFGSLAVPQRFTNYEWTEHLKKAWTQHPEVALLNHLPKNVDVDIEWKLYNRILYDMFHSVQKEFGTPEDRPTGFKGDNVKIKQIAKRVCLDLGDMKSRKGRNWIARAETFIQKVQVHPQFTHCKEYMVLKRKLETMISLRSKLRLRRLRLKNNPTEMP